MSDLQPEALIRYTPAGRHIIDAFLDIFNQVAEVSERDNKIHLGFGLS
jgi:hypothetical protein